MADKRSNLQTNVLHNLYVGSQNSSDSEDSPIERRRAEHEAAHFKNTSSRML